MTKTFRIPGVALMLLPALLSGANPALARSEQGQLDCANMRREVLHLVGDWAREMLFASHEMSSEGWIDGNVARSAFKDVQIAVMRLDHAYEDVSKTREACRQQMFDFGLQVGTYIEEVMVTGTRPAKGIAGW